MKKLLFALFSIIFISCQNNTSKNGDLNHLLPEKSAVILYSPNLPGFFRQLSGQDFLSKNSENLKFSFTKKLAILKELDSIDEAYISFTDVSDSGFNFTLISNKTPVFAETDSLQSRLKTDSAIEEKRISTITFENQKYFAAKTNNAFLAGNSKENIQNILDREALLKDNTFQKSLTASDKKRTNLFINHSFSSEILTGIFPGFDLSQKPKLATWSVIDLEITKEEMGFNGIALTSYNEPSLLSIFRDTGAGLSETAKLSPNSAKGFYAISFRNFAKFEENLKSYNNDTTKTQLPKFLSSAIEIGVIYSKDQSLVVNSNNVEIAKEELSIYVESEEEFRGIKLYKLGQKELLSNKLKPLVTFPSTAYYMAIDHFLVFGSSKEGLEEIISARQTNSTLAQQEKYEAAINNLASQGSLLFVANTSEFKPVLGKMVPKNEQDKIKNIDFKDFGIAAIQFVEEGEFSHIHGSLRKTESSSKNTDISQELSIKLKNPITGTPQFFKNHRTNQLDIAVQDQQNLLYLISNKGNVFWKKQLQSQIQGKIHEVDLFRNGKFQLAFNTLNKVQVIDRVGNRVKPFPLEFNDPITQPLSIFDYDNNRKYRFLVTQNRDTYMFDGKGRSVNGFDFNRTDSEIIRSPKHIRLGRKDYIVVPESSGKLNILSRQGNTRVSVNEKIDFSDNEWYEYEGDFISTTEKGELVTVNESGNVTRKDLDLSENHSIDATIKSLVSLSENILTIKGKEAELDFGLYTKPQIFYVQDKIYVSVTDLQTEKVYIFDSNARLLPNFPVYGTSEIDLDNADTDRNIEFVVKGAEDEIILYQF
ncbi:hypothetical protein [Salegentibacter chungangensis]|uniref:Uncharacterized protein n=1 Tax=Salegentibacter chungangensis TaxID=1335724 RepID=A0ABW3NKI4_9FLAO